MVEFLGGVLYWDPMCLMLDGLRAQDGCHILFQHFKDFGTDNASNVRPVGTGNAELQED